MSGMLLYGKEFREEHYVSANGTPHFEVRPIDGDFLGISHDSWQNIQTTCSRFAISPDMWPEYTYSIDVPLDEVRRKNDELRTRLLAIPVETTRSVRWLCKIQDLVRTGNLILFCAVY